MHDGILTESLTEGLAVTQLLVFRCFCSESAYKITVLDVTQDASYYYIILVEET